MPWELTPNSGPYPGPWEGKDVVSWLWEIYRGDESRHVLVEVTGTAMAVDEEFLPNETAEARRTSGRTEVEKVLHLDDPPRRISLGTTGYLASSEHRTRPDFLVTNAAGDAVAAVEVHNPEVLTEPLAVLIRSRLAPWEGDWRAPYRFLLVLSQNTGFLFDQEVPQAQPVARFSMLEVVQHYYPHATAEQRFRGSELEIIVYEWLRDLAEGMETDREAEMALRHHALIDSVRGGKVEVEPA